MRVAPLRKNDITTGEMPWHIAIESTSELELDMGVSEVSWTHSGGARWGASAISRLRL
jgi:hypothetical protein